jgi:tetratricopeptide (TPR) repeat protein
MRPLRAATLAVAALLIAGVADAQKQPKEPRRPKMEASRDTNAAAAYYYWGLGQLRSSPRSAQDAFYWAARLDPTWAEPLYAQRIAYHLSDLERFWKYLNGTKYVLRHAETRRIDSLQYRAMLRDPFLFRRHDKMLIDELVNALTEGYGGLMGSSPSFLAWAAYSETKFPQAVALYAKAIEKKPKNYELHAERARAFFHMGRFDSTVAEMNRALEGYRKDDEKDLVVLYESKAMYEYSIANAYIQAGKLQEAREALGRALAEDLSFYMAHQQMAALSLAAGDTATALSEYELAVQLNTDDAPLRTEYGAVLARLGKNAEAEPHLVRSIEIEPWYSRPYAVLATVYEGLGKNAEAVAQYNKFLALSSQKDELRPVAQQRLTALSSVGGKQ